MTARVRQALLWGGMFVLAYAGGNWLGSFTVSGLSDEERQTAEAAEAANFWQAQDDSEERSAAPDAPVRRIIYAAPGNHVCDGCDAGITRDRQMAAQLGIPYPEDSADAEAAPVESDEDAALPQPVARVTLPPVPPTP